MLRARHIFRIAALAAGITVAPAAQAHPHIIATLHVDVIFNVAGALEGVRETWTYDAAYSNFIRKQIDADNDGNLSEVELNGFASIHRTELEKFQFFTSVELAKSKVNFGQAADFAISEAGAGLLQFSVKLPLSSPTPIRSAFSIEVFDPNFFAYFSPGEQTAPAALINAPYGCTAESFGPQPIDLKQTRSIPKAFWAALDGSFEDGKKFVNRITVTCPSPTQISHR